MKNQKFFVRLLCVVLAALMVLSLIIMVIPARAVSASDIETLEVRRRALEEQLQAQEELIQSLEDNHSLIIDRKAALDREITLNQESIDLMEEQVAAYDILLAEKEGELSQARAEEQEQIDLFRGRIRAMEENGSYSYYSVLFDSASMTDFMSRLTDMTDIMDYDRQVIENLRTAREAVEALAREVEEIFLEQSQIDDELNARRERLSAQMEAACRLIEDLSQQSENAEAEYAAIEEAEYQAYQEELAALAQYAAQYGGGGGGSVGGFGGFIWPVDSNLVTSRFGERERPTPGASTNHQAVDIGASEGSPVYAAADGQVVVATYNDGLGYYVSIAHADGTSTRYSHLSSYIVSVGQSVIQGQIIGYVGSTGVATGSHLDFSVSQNGQQVDPLQFFDNSSLSFSPTA